MKQLKYKQFRKVALDMQVTSMCGLYLCTATYKNRRSQFITNDSELYDQFNHSANAQQHREACRALYNLVKQQELREASGRL